MLKDPRTAPPLAVTAYGRPASLKTHPRGIHRHNV
jgi:hypothetical protein